MENILAKYDDLYGLFASERFLSRYAVANEVPLFVCHYPPAEQDACDQVVAKLVDKLNRNGVPTCHIRLYETMIAVLRETRLLDKILAREQSLPADRLIGNISTMLDSGNGLIAHIRSQIAQSEVKLVIITGIGACHPAVQAKKLLSELEGMHGVPIVLFFPGDYVQTPGSGASLHLFNLPGGKGYYRAFDIDTFIAMKASH